MEETLINRTMPNSREAEQSVIGSMTWHKMQILTAMANAPSVWILLQAVRDPV